MLSRLWQSYSAALRGPRALPVKVATGFAVGSVGDVLAQYRDASVLEWSARRTALWALWVGAAHAPLFHTWFGIAERLMPAPAASASVVSRGAVGIKKALTEAFVVGLPYCAATTTYSTVAIRQMHSVADVQAALQERLIPAWLSVATVLLPAQSVAHTFIPVQFRVLWLGCWGVIANMLLSTAINRRPAAAAAAQPSAAEDPLPPPS
eukprot:TRINITY_DN4978_c0_g1_i1.p1 TRINITY_DN4978_c0_g1~~TRINITY_DN4978_c0_g1_i1.p1  ORF type:complete len:208 (+),score=21.37 TRINITY_DN4978_c0_g1_i1:79-702(+)